MLFDPKWERRADPVSHASLIAWLETMPADETYPFLDCAGRCLYSQYLSALGHGDGLDLLDPSHWLWVDLHGPSFRHIAAARPHTFGAALERARASLVAE